MSFRICSIISDKYLPHSFNYICLEILVAFLRNHPYHYRLLRFRHILDFIVNSELTTFLNNTKDNSQQFFLRFIWFIYIPYFEISEQNVVEVFLPVNSLTLATKTQSAYTFRRVLLGHNDKPLPILIKLYSIYRLQQQIKDSKTDHMKVLLFALKFVNNN